MKVEMKEKINFQNRCKFIKYKNSNSKNFFTTNN